MQNVDAVIHYFSTLDSKLISARMAGSSSPLARAIASDLEYSEYTLSTVILDNQYDLTDLSRGGVGAIVEAEAFTFGRVCSVSQPFCMLFESFFKPDELKARGVTYAVKQGEQSYGLSIVRTFLEFSETTMVQSMFKEMPALIFRDESDRALREYLKGNQGSDLIGRSAGFIVARVYDGESLLLGLRRSPIRTG
jgi:hypothetical protein